MARKHVLIATALLAVFAAGVGLGMAVQAAAGEKVSGSNRTAAANKEPAPPLEDWRYPGASDRGHEGSAGVEENGRLVVPPTHIQVWATPDDLDKVVAFYGRKCGFEQTGGGAGSGSRGRGDEIWVYFNPRTAQSGPSRETYLRRRGPSYDLTVCVTRLRGEGPTRIALVYEPKVLGHP
jgi:hypothetical protein